MFPFFVYLFLKCNGYDLTMCTHKKAVDYIKKYPVLNMLVARKGVTHSWAQDRLDNKDHYQLYIDIYILFLRWKKNEPFQ
jgi:hypothetical protein